MNRREFHGMLIGAVAVGGLTAVGPTRAPAHVTAAPVSTNVYRYRLRYTRKYDTLSFWMRVSNISRLEADVPFSLTAYTDPARTTAVAQRHYTARALDSHIIRGQIVDIPPALWKPGSPLYVALSIGEEKVSSRAWKLKGV